jgi:hypothetical protein
LSGQLQNSLSGQKNTLQKDSIVATIPPRLVATKKSMLSCFLMASQVLFGTYSDVGI